MPTVIMGRAMGMVRIAAVGALLTHCMSTEEYDARQKAAREAQLEIRQQADSTAREARPEIRQKADSTEPAGVDPSAFWAIALAVLFLYFLPSIVARSRMKRNTTAIFMLNLLLGWTVLGWICALVWALTHDPARPTS